MELENHQRDASRLLWYRTSDNIDIIFTIWLQSYGQMDGQTEK